MTGIKHYITVSFPNIHTLNVHTISSAWESSGLYELYFAQGEKAHDFRTPFGFFPVSKDLIYQDIRMYSEGLRVHTFVCRSRLNVYV